MSNRSNSSNKRPRSPSPAAVNTRYKGVVPQISGHWGAQIYANHQRIWLGTFKSEKEAAMAYDTAAIKLRSGDSHRNFPWSPISAQEPVFQKHYSTESVLSMIKDGSYATKFSEFLMQNKGKSNEDDHEKYDNASAGSSFFMENNSLMLKMKVNGMEKFTCRKLFRKELTPSDVGKLNRLVIPKKFAVKFFPEIISAENNKSAASEEGQGNGNDNDCLLSFYDASARLWKFRYCYWKSSQSFVFTRGWNRFVKEKELKDKDVITFFVCEGDPKAMKNNTNENDLMTVSPFYLIDASYRYSRDNTKDANVQFTKEDVIGDNRKENDSKGTSESEVAEEEEGEEYSTAEVQEQSGSKKITSLRLFGVDIQK